MINQRLTNESGPSPSDTAGRSEGGNTGQDKGKVVTELDRTGSYGEVEREERDKAKGKAIMEKGEVTSSDDESDYILRRKDAELRDVVYENLDPIIPPPRRQRISYDFDAETRTFLDMSGVFEEEENAKKLDEIDDEAKDKRKLIRQKDGAYVDISTCQGKEDDVNKGSGAKKLKIINR